jgi:hemerythrin
MKEVQWTDDLSVGIGVIDEQHKMLIQHLNNLTKSIERRQGPAAIAETLGFLIEYTHFHFSAEEKHMAACNYPKLEHHQMKHNEFRTALGNSEKDFTEEGATRALAHSIDTLLVAWLIKHIRGVDVDFGEFVAKEGITVAEEG